MSAVLVYMYHFGTPLIINLDDNDSNLTVIINSEAIGIEKQQFSVKILQQY